MLWPNWMRWSPWTEMSRIQREMNRFFEDYVPAVQHPQGPPLNVWQGSDSCAVTVELPGVEAKDIDISVLDDQMTVRAKRTTESPGEEYAAVRREQSRSGNQEGRALCQGAPTGSRQAQADHGEDLRDFKEVNNHGR